jgi:lysophospholipase L1-like esterase
VRTSRLALLFGLSTILLGHAEAGAAENLPVGSWSTPPENIGSGTGQVTVREFVHSSVGGTAARIRFSNEYGQEPLVVQDIHLALRDTSTANGVLTTTDRVVTFAGASSVTIPVGASAVSDLVEMRVLPLTDIGVSFYLPASTFTSVTGQGGTFGKPGYLAYGGDFTAAATLPPGSPTYGTAYFLVGLDVQGQNAKRAVVALGASITGGVGSTPDANNRWTDVLAHRLLEHGIPVGVLNSGISGDNALNDAGGPNAQRRFDTDVIAQAGVGWVIISDFPINNFGSNPSTGAEPIAALQQLIARSHAKQIQVLCSTLTPFKGFGAWTPVLESGREEYNAFVKSKSSGCDGVIDQAKAVGDPRDPQQYLAAYDSGDHLHPNPAGHAAIANSIDLRLFSDPASN